MMFPSGWKPCQRYAGIQISTLIMLIKIINPFTNVASHASGLDFDFFGRGFGGSFVTAT